MRDDCSIASYPIEWLIELTHVQTNLHIICNRCYFTWSISRTMTHLTWAQLCAFFSLAICIRLLRCDLSAYCSNLLLHILCSDVKDFSSFFLCVCLSATLISLALGQPPLLNSARSNQFEMSLCSCFALHNVSFAQFVWDERNYKIIL